VLADILPDLLLDELPGGVPDEFLLPGEVLLDAEIV